MTKEINLKEFIDSCKVLYSYDDDPINAIKLFILNPTLDIVKYNISYQFFNDKFSMEDGDFGYHDLIIKKDVDLIGDIKVCSMNKEYLSYVIMAVSDKSARGLDINSIIPVFIIPYEYVIVRIKIPRKLLKEHFIIEYTGYMITNSKREFLMERGVELKSGTLV
jgi:hypothetical protein